MRNSKTHRLTLDVHDIAILAGLVQLAIKDKDLPDFQDRLSHLDDLLSRTAWMQIEVIDVRGGTT